jgi:hypothetical protein
MSNEIAGNNLQEVLESADRLQIACKSIREILESVEKELEIIREKN